MFDKRFEIVLQFYSVRFAGGIKPNISNFGADQFDSRRALDCWQMVSVMDERGAEGRKAREEFCTRQKELFNFD